MKFKSLPIGAKFEFADESKNEILRKVKKGQKRFFVKKSGDQYSLMATFNSDSVYESSKLYKTAWNSLVRAL